MLISKEQFINSLNALKRAYEEHDNIEEALKPFFDNRRPILTAGEGCREALNELLVVCSECHEEDDIFSWWLFDSCKKEIILDSGTDKERVYNVETPEGLYGYLYDMYHHDD